MTSTATRPSSVAPTVARRPGLDVLRGVAATAVVVSHVAFVSGVVNPERWSSQLRLLLPRLDVGVPIFFVLSGLLIARPFLRAVADDRPAPAPVRYLLRRAARIYPLYWVVLAVSLAAASGELPSVAKLLSYVGLVHIYRPATAIGPITQSWSLATELSFYLLVPVWFWACRRVLDRFGVSGRERRLRWMGLALVGWVVVALAWRAGVVAATDTFDYTKAGAVDVRGALLTWLPNHLDEFAVGIGLAVLLELRRDRDRLAAIGPVGRIACYVVAAAALWIASAHLDLPPLHTGFDGFQTLARHALFLVTAALVVAPSALAVAGRFCPEVRPTGGENAGQNRRGTGEEGGAGRRGGRARVLRGVPVAPVRGRSMDGASGPSRVPGSRSRRCSSSCSPAAPPWRSSATGSSRSGRNRWSRRCSTPRQPPTRARPVSSARRRPSTGSVACRSSPCSAPT
ncbi:MAG: acyltransferase [Microthrixaceae bacterium]